MKTKFVILALLMATPAFAVDAVDRDTAWDRTAKGCFCWTTGGRSASAYCPKGKSQLGTNWDYRTITPMGRTIHGNGHHTGGWPR